MAPISIYVPGAPSIGDRGRRIALPGGTSFSPGSLSAVKYWVDAGTITGVTNGSAITTAKLVDQSLTASGALAQATNAIYRTAGYTGLPALDFNGTDSVIVSGALSIPTNRRVFMVMSVLSPIDTGMNSKYFLDGASLGQGTITFGGGDILFAGVQDASGVGKSVCLERYTPVLLDVVQNGASSSIQVSGQTKQAGNMTGQSTYTAITVGCPGNQLGGYFANLQVSELIVCDSTLTAPQAAQITAYLNAKHGIITRKYLYTGGDSLTYGQGASSNAMRWPDQAVSLLAGGTSRWILQNYGEGGSAIPQANTTASTYNDTDAKYFAKAVSVIWCGTNDIFSGASAATCWSNLQTYCANRRAATPNQKLIVLTTVKRGTFDAGMEAARVAYNSSIMSGWSGIADAVFDVASHANFASSSNLTYYQADGIHLTDAGYTTVANALAPIIEDLAA